jgi:hypothetical protein
MSNVDLEHAKFLEYLRALRDMLAAAQHPDWPVNHALASLDDVLQQPRPDLDREADYLRARLAEVERARQGEPYRGEAAAGPHAFTGPLDGKCLTCGQPSGALVHEAYRRRADYEHEDLDEPERPAYDQAEQDETAWCIECGQVCGHAGHRHGSGDHGEIVCEQCGVTLSDD